MKKILILFAFLVASISLMAQTTTIANGSFKTQAATTIAAATSYTYKVADGADPYYIGYQVAVDSVVGTAAGLGAVLTLHGSFDGVDYSPALYTVTYYGVIDTSSDTVVVSSNTTASYYRYLKATWTVTDTIQIGHTLRLSKIKY